MLGKSAKNITISILLFVGSLLIALAGAEFFLRNTTEPLEEIEKVHTYTQFNINYGLEPVSNLELEEYGQTVRTNSHSMYGPELSGDENAYRIAFMGDSYSVGPGIAYEDNYPYLYAQALKENHPKIDMIFGALGGSSPAQQELILKHKILNYKPDLIVYQLFLNDIGDDYYFKLSPYFARTKTYYSFPQWLRQFRIIQKLIVYRMGLLEKQYEKTYNEKHITEDKYDVNSKQVWQTITAPALESIAKMAKDNDIELVVFYIPAGTEIKNEYGVDMFDGRSFLGPVAKKWAKEKGIRFFDLYDDFNKENTAALNELYLPAEKGLHLTQRGAKITAQKLIEIAGDL